MKQTKFILKWIPALALIVFFQSCKKPKPIPPRGEYEGGYFILNEGQFMHDNASVSHIKEDFTGKEDSVYFKVNNMVLGDVAQSLFANDNKIYFLINNSHKIVVANRWTMEHKLLVTSFVKSPRYMIKISDRYALVSNWGEVFDSNWADVEDDYIAWYDMENDVITDTLHVDLGPNQMVYENGNVYLLISGVGQSRNKVSVIDPVGKQIITDITVGDRPASIDKDDDDFIWVLSSGNAAWTGNETPGNLSKINPATNQVELSLQFDVTQHPQFMDVDDNKIFYILNNKVYLMSTSDTSLPSQEIIDLSGDITTPYGLKITDDYIFVMDANAYNDIGKVVVYDKNNYSKVTEITTGFLPNDILKNDD